MRKKMFTKAETISLTAIFLLLLVVSIPNFMASLRRARDQVRRDDMGSLMGALDLFHSEFGVFPLSSEDGKIVACLNPGGVKPYVDKSGKWIFDVKPCEWGKDSFVNLVTGEKYINVLPCDPDYQKGSNYLYISDGAVYQLLATMEGKDEAEVDSEIISMNLNCGGRVCNIGRSYGCDFPKTVEECSKEALSDN